MFSARTLSRSAGWAWSVSAAIGIGAMTTAASADLSISAFSLNFTEGHVQAGVAFSDAWAPSPDARYIWRDADQVVLVDGFYQPITVMDDASFEQALYQPEVLLPEPALTNSTTTIFAPAAGASYADPVVVAPDSLPAPNVIYATSPSTVVVYDWYRPVYVPVYTPVYTSYCWPTWSYHRGHWHRTSWSCWDPCWSSWPRSSVTFCDDDWFGRFSVSISFNFGRSSHCWDDWSWRRPAPIHHWNRWDNDNRHDYRYGRNDGRGRDWNDRNDHRGNDWNSGRRFADVTPISQPVAPSPVRPRGDFGDRAGRGGPAVVTSPAPGGETRTVRVERERGDRGDRPDISSGKGPSITKRDAEPAKVTPRITSGNTSSNGLITYRTPRDEGDTPNISPSFKPIPAPVTSAPRSDSGKSDGRGVDRAAPTVVTKPAPAPTTSPVIEAPRQRETRADERPRTTDGGIRGNPAKISPAVQPAAPARTPDAARPVVTPRPQAPRPEVTQPDRATERKPVTQPSTRPAPQAKPAASAPVVAPSAPKQQTVVTPVQRETRREAAPVQRQATPEVKAPAAPPRMIQQPQRQESAPRMIPARESKPEAGRASQPAPQPARQAPAPLPARESKGEAPRESKRGGK